MMTLLEFIEYQQTIDSPLGNLARDILQDKGFPKDETEAQMITYLKHKNGFWGTLPLFEKMMIAYHQQRNEKGKRIKLSTQGNALTKEQWQFYKDYFPVDQVILVGKPNDIYKAYCLESIRKNALYFDLKSSLSLNKIKVLKEHAIQMGDATQKVTVKRAIELLTNCRYETPLKPNPEKFKELIEFLKMRIY